MTDGTKGGAADPKGKRADIAAAAVDTAAEIDGQLLLDGWPVIDDTGKPTGEKRLVKIFEHDEIKEMTEAEFDARTEELNRAGYIVAYPAVDDNGTPIIDPDGEQALVLIPPAPIRSTWEQKAKVQAIIYKGVSRSLETSEDEERRERAADFAEFADRCIDIAARYEIYLQYIQEEIERQGLQAPGMEEYGDYYFILADRYISENGIQPPGPGKVEPDQGEKDAIADMIAKSFSEEKTEIEDTIADIWAGDLVRPNSKKTTLTTSRAARDQLSIAAESEQGNAALIDVGNGADITAVIYRQEVTVQKITPQEKLGLTPEGIELQDVIGSLFDAAGGGPAYMTPAQIYREFAGLKSKTPITKDQEAWIMDEVDNMATLRTKIDYTMQASKHKDLRIDPDTATIEDYVINATKIKTKVGGHVTNCYRINAQLPYYEYSRKIHQAQTIDKKMLEYPGRNNTARFALLKRILAKIVLHMKADQKENGEKYEARRTYAGIFERMGIKPTEKQARTLKDDIDKLLKYWKEQEEIKDFTRYSNKGQREKAGIKIELYPLAETDQRTKVKK